MQSYSNSLIEKLELNWLYLDLNSYFATVEQQLNPELRGKPLIIVPTLSDYTCAIAASYEAKKLGIKTGTKVKEARAICPGIICIPARHDVYVEFHHKILAEIDKYLYVEHVLSIDEYACKLTGMQKSLEESISIARRIKNGIKENVGDYILCSIGIAPGRFLAKIATEIEKTDGLVVIRPEDIPHKLCGLKIRDITGIGSKTEQRLARFGINSVADLYRPAAKELRRIWGSIRGERFWYELRGIEVEEPPSDRKSISRSKVLTPDARTINLAKDSCIALVLNAAAKLRAEKVLAGKVSLFLLTEKYARAESYCKLLNSCDSRYLLKEALKLWEKLTEERLNPCDKIKKITVVCSSLTPQESNQLEFGAEEVPKAGRKEREKVGNNLSRALDKLNERYGRRVVSIGIKPDQNIKAKIAFGSVPGKKDFF